MNHEAQLLRLARTMDKEALTEIFDHYAHPLYNYVLRFGCDPLLADQIVGDVFAKLLDQLSIGKGPLTNLRAYLYEVAYHLAVDELRYVSHRAPIERVELYRHNRYSLNPDIEKGREVENILEAMQSLSADQRHIIILRILEGFSIGETAAILGKTPGSVKVAQCRALEILRKTVVGKTSSAAPSSSPGVEMTLSAY